MNENPIPLPQSRHSRWNLVPTVPVVDLERKEIDGIQVRNDSEPKDMVTAVGIGVPRALGSGGVGVRLI